MAMTKEEWLDKLSSELEAAENLPEGSRVDGLRDMLDKYDAQGWSIPVTIGNVVRTTIRMRHPHLASELGI